MGTEHKKGAFSNCDNYLSLIVFLLYMSKSKLIINNMEDDGSNDEKMEINGEELDIVKAII